ncbi:hypothetical protein FB451DRAFT_1404471 [Mycena latifolia]|nr:hypothetical protein FB451DRAFT_1404471 [Mycena latifolia]
MSGLTDINLYDPERDFLTGFLSRLDPSNNAGFLPRLQSLALAFAVDPRQFYLREITRMLSSRGDARNGVAKLQSFRAIWIKGKRIRLEESTVVATLRALVASGMEIHIGDKERNLI